MKEKKKLKRSWKNEEKKSSGSDMSSGESDLNLDNPNDLTDYAGDCIKLMGDVFKILGDKKLKQMIPNVLKPITIEDLKVSMVEESMALSKKRVTSILNGITYSSSSDTDEEENLPQITTVKKDPDVISLDGITDDSDIFCWDDDLPESDIGKKQTEPSKHELKSAQSEKKKNKKPKKHKSDDHKTHKSVEKPAMVAEEKAMTALELLELQARARAIKSQLALESSSLPTEKIEDDILKNEESPKPIEPKRDSVEIDQIVQVPSTSASNNVPPISKKVKLRRNHLRIHPNKSSIPEVVVTATKLDGQKSKSMTEDNEPDVKLETVTEEDTVIENTEKQSRQRRGSTDSLILEIPSHPLIVISSEEDNAEHSKGNGRSRNYDKRKLKTHYHDSSLLVDRSVFTDKEKKYVEIINQKTQSSSSEEGEISEDSETENVKVKNKTNHSDDNTKSNNSPPNETKQLNESNEDLSKENQVYDKLLQSSDNISSENTELKYTQNEHEQNATIVCEKVQEVVDQDCIVLDSEPEFDSEEETQTRIQSAESPPPSTRSTNSTPNADHDDNLEKTTWKSRWLDSARVQNVLQTSKLYNNMKRNLTSKKEQQSLVEPKKVTESKTNVATSENVGSVDHFNALNKSTDKLVEKTTDLNNVSLGDSSENAVDSVSLEKPS